MRQLTEDEEKAMQQSRTDFMDGCEENEITVILISATYRQAWKDALSYQDKRIEALETIIKNALNEAYQSEVLDTQMESSLIGNAYADKQDWLDSRIEEWK